MLNKYWISLIEIFEWTAPLTSLASLHLWPLRLFSYSLRRVYVINKEVCVRTVCAHEELLRGGVSKLCVYVSLCVSLCSQHSSLSVFSGPVSWSVLPLRRGSTEWTVFITRRKLWKELWWLLIESGLYLPTYCRFSTCGPHPLTLLLPLFLPPLYNSLLLHLKVCVLFLFACIFPHVCLPSRSCVYGLIYSKEQWWLYKPLVL